MRGRARWRCAVIGASIAVFAAAAEVSLALAQDAAEHPASAPEAASDGAGAEQPPAAAASPAPASASSPSSSDSHRGASAKNTTGAPSAPGNSPFAGFGITNSKGPTRITSDTMTLEYKDKYVIFSGHVHATQPNGDLTSNTLKVVYADPDFKELSAMFADGDVRMSQGTRWVTGEHAVLDEQKHTVVMTGNPIVHDGEDQITGAKITVYLQTSRSVVEGGVHAVVFPRKSENADNVDSSDRQ